MAYRVMSLQIFETVGWDFSNKVLKKIISDLGSNYLNGQLESQRWGTAHASIVPYQSFKTKDGFFTVGKIFHLEN